ncbi:MAG TPA: ABC transporter substrate-binding protein, partial [Euzebyales bacterium]|nr:ABC transporter substrate-binding protein [Euzebyales bacterium]
MRILRRRGPLLVVVVMTMAPACTGAAGVPPTGISDVAHAAHGSSAGATPMPAGEPIRIGGTLGLTGTFAGPSAAAMAAYEYWAADVNASGGLLGRPVELVIYDDGSNPATARDLYRRLIDQDQVDLLLGPYGTRIGVAVLPLAEDNGMVLFNGGFAGLEHFRGTDWMVGAATYQEPDVARGVFELIDTLPWHRRPRRIGIATVRDPVTLRVRDGVDGEGGVRALA